MKRLLIVSLFLIFANILQAAAVVFNNTNLRHDVLWQHVPRIDPNDANRPTQADMNGLISLTSSSRGISDLTGLQTAINLQSLDLSHNNISNLSRLSGLTKLTSLSLRYNNLSNISSLSGLTNLITLSLSYSNSDILDVHALSGMNKLVELGLTDVNVITITPLADVNQIQVLWLGSNRIADISVLTLFKKLNILALPLNPMDFVSWTDDLKEILANNPAMVPPTSTKYLTSSPLIANYSTDMTDLSKFAARWLRNDCSLSNGYCQGADFGEDGTVDFYDFAIFADWWMYKP
jgi:Leucine-rich repeat (LRR) protein